MTTFLAWARLLRLPNGFSAIADVLMGHWFVVTGAPSPVTLGLAVASSWSLYHAGMVWNDWFDLEVDRKERPFRPLPSGRISLNGAATLGTGLIIVGWIAGLILAIHAARIAPAFAWTAAGMPLVLSAFILVYDAGGKQTPLGPWLMGGCRALNVLWGMTAGQIAQAAVSLESGEGSGTSSEWAIDWLPLDGSMGLVAAGIGTYVAGITYLSRCEVGALDAEGAPTSRTLLPVVVMAGGLILLACFPGFGAFGAGSRRLTMNTPWVWPALVACLGLTIVRRAATALRSGKPHAIQIAVKTSIFSLVVIDAAICLAVRSPPTYALAVLLLLVPMIVLGRWVYST